MVKVGQFSARFNSTSIDLALISAFAQLPTIWRQEMEKYYFLKCALFDRVRIEAPTSVIDSSSFTVRSKASVKDALTVVGGSPFKTACVIDEANKKYSRTTG